MMLRIAVILLAISAGPVSAKPADAASCLSPSPEITQSCARIALVEEFVRELEVLYRLQDTAKKELAEDGLYPSDEGRLADRRIV
jgi:hypothetical protein